MADAQFTEEMAIQILATDASPIRFEAFCVDLFSDIDQREYVTTSRSYDLGRDGRSIKPEKVPPFLCCGTGKDDPLNKAETDTNRILETISPVEVLFCFTHPDFTEYKANQIEQAIRALVPDVMVVRSFGGHQLGKLAFRYPAVFERHYLGELTALRSALSVSGSASKEIELTGLRIALTTQLHDDAQARRRDMVQNLILTALATAQRLSQPALAKAVGDKLRLRRPVHVGWLLSELNQLSLDGLVSQNGIGYEITESGKEALAERTSQGAASLSYGQQKVRYLIEELTGQASSDAEFRLVWNVLQDGIVTMFVNHGATIIDSLASVAAGATSVEAESDLRLQVHSIAQRILEVSGGGGAGSRMVEVAQAIEDMFQERTSPAFEWLASIGEIFLHLCSLGLEPAAQQQVIEHLQEIELFLDTDMVLSLLSRGEANHTAVSAMIDQWKNHGGQIWVTPAVLEEAAHHAWISRNDYNDVERSLDSMSDPDSYHLIGNVFVRGFRTEQKHNGRKCIRREWNYYISAFKGETHHDYSRIMELLSEQGIRLLDESNIDVDAAAMVSEAVFQARKGATHYLSMSQLREKSDRDGRMAAALVAHRESLTSIQKTAIIISTSTALRIGIRSLGEKVGSPEAVLYTPAVFWILSLIPGGQMSTATLRAVLFDVDFPVRMDPLERRALRVLHHSQQYKMHYSRRPTLRRFMRDEIRNRAAVEGKNREDKRAELLATTETSNEMFADVVAVSIDMMSTSKSEAENAELREQIAILERKLERERAKKK